MTTVNGRSPGGAGSTRQWRRRRAFGGRAGAATLLPIPRPIPGISRPPSLRLRSALPLASQLEEQVNEVQAARTRVEKLNAAISAAERAAGLDAELAALAGATARVESLASSWQESNARRVELAAQLRHDEEHREAIIADVRTLRARVASVPTALTGSRFWRHSNTTSIRPGPRSPSSTCDWPISQRKVRPPAPMPTGPSSWQESDVRSDTSGIRTSSPVSSKLAPGRGRDRRRPGGDRADH